MVTFTLNTHVETTVLIVTENLMPNLYREKRYLKIPKISPGLIFGGAYLQREISVSKSIGLALKLEGNLEGLIFGILRYFTPSKITFHSGKQAREKCNQIIQYRPKNSNENGQCMNFLGDPQTSMGDFTETSLLI